MTDKQKYFIHAYLDVCKISERYGVGSTIDADDFDRLMKYRGVLGQDDAGIAMVNLTMEPGQCEQQTQTLKAAMIAYGIKRLSVAAGAVTTLLSAVSANADNLEDIATLITAGSQTGTPMQINAARQLDAIVTDWASKWPLTLTDPLCDGIENVAKRFGNLRKHYDDIALDLNPDKAMVPNNNAVSVMDDKFTISELAVANTAVAANTVSWGAGDTLLRGTAPLAAGDIVADPNGTVAVGISPGPLAHKVAYTLNNIAAGYTFVFSITQIYNTTVGQPATYDTYTVVPAIVANNTPNSIASDVNLTYVQNFGMRYSYNGITEAKIAQNKRFANYVSSVVYRNTMNAKTYVCEVEVPDNFQAGGVIRFFDDDAVGHGGFFIIRIDRVYSTGSGGSSRYLYTKDGALISRDTKLITAISNMPGWYARAVFNSPYTWEALGELIRYDYYKASKNQSTMAQIIASAYNNLINANGDTMPSAEWTSERVFNLFFWLAGQPNLTKASAEILYRQFFNMFNLHFNLMCGDVSYWRYTQMIDNPNLKV